MGTKKLLGFMFIICQVFTANLAWAAGAGKYSGFIDNYPELQLDKDGSGAMIYRKPGMELGGYQKIMIDPIEIWYAEDSKYKGISPDDLKAITDALYESLLAGLEPDYPVVSRPGEGVLRIRLAITDVHAKKKKRKLIGYTPVGLVVGGIRNLAGVAKNITLKDATIEGELMDAHSMEQIGVLIDKLSVSKKNLDEDGNASREGIAESLDFYARRLRARLDAERGK